MGLRRGLTRAHELEVEQWALWGQVATQVGVGGAVVGGVVALSSFLPGAPFVPRAEAVGWFLLLLVVPLLLGTVLALRLGGIVGVRDTVQAFVGLPKATLRLTLVVVVAFVVVALTALGSPFATEERDGRYFANDEAVTVELTRGEYDQRQAEGSRQAAAAAGVLYTVLAAAGLLVRKDPEASLV